MKKALAAILITSTVLLGGCAGTSATLKSEYRLAQGEKVKLQLHTPQGASTEGMSILRERLVLQLSASGLFAGANDATARTLDVNVTNYYMRHGATRHMVGILAGADNIQSTVTIREAATGKVLSEFKVESKNPTGWGTSRGLIQEHSDKIVEMLKGVKS
jgi:hypothetical protein